MILLWGIASDGPLSSVQATLLRLGAGFKFVDQQDVLRCRLELTVNGGVGGRIETPQWSADLNSFNAVYLRPYDVRRLPAMQGVKPTNLRWRRALQFDDTLTCWMDMTPSFVISRPSAMASNNSKPYQLSLIQAAGFAVPDTLVTTDTTAAIEFWEQHGSVVYKSISGTRSIVSRVRAEHRDRFPDLANCPTQFQQYIEGIDYRIHVVGDEVFGCEICSDADDYRYPQLQGAELQVRQYEVPPDVSQSCRFLAASLNLPVAGLDLRRSAAGEWFCFEANPSPAFTFYQDTSAQPISWAIAELLAGAVR
jgi:glutathione synthase/RimK-type ligase-like ATP-grasp enzyme